MEFIETPVYTKQILQLLEDDEYRKLQNFLAKYPESGDIIKKSGGLRKIRWKSKNIGKSGGIRNIYYYYKESNSIYMLLAYKKGRQDNLSDKELSILKKIIKGD
jgi:mRNA-degrading endonuclease RelE of RelBE toxin-antitoxin system